MEESLVKKKIKNLTAGKSRPMVSARAVEIAYRAAKARYAAFGINPDAAIRKVGQLPISIHCDARSSVSLRQTIFQPR